MEIPTGNRPEDIIVRRNIIARFYREWKIAKKVGAVPPKANGNQKPFESMIIMHYESPGIGTVKMTVGVRRGNHEKVQYCITAIEG